MKILYFIMILTLIFLACDPNSSGELPPPEKVLMVEKYTDLGVVEHGIDAVPERNAIYIEWHLLDDPDITAYNIHRKFKVASLFSKLISIPVENNISQYDTVYSYTDDDNIKIENSDSLYYYYVNATNKDGVVGPNSDTLSYMLFTKPETYIIQNFNSDEQPVVSWDFLTEPVPYYYIIRIEDELADTLVWARRFVNAELDRDPVKDLSNVLNPPKFHAGSTYRWRIDRVGPDSLYSGSESKWKTFFVN
jgi:hypothetical protein